MMIDLNARDYKVSIASDKTRVEAKLDLPLDTVAGRRRLGRVVKKLERVWQDAEETAFLARNQGMV